MRVQGTENCYKESQFAWTDLLFIWWWRKTSMWSKYYGWQRSSSDFFPVTFEIVLQNPSCLTLFIGGDDLEKFDVFFSLHASSPAHKRDQNLPGLGEEARIPWRLLAVRGLFSTLQNHRKATFNRLVTGMYLSLQHPFGAACWVNMFMLGIIDLKTRSQTVSIFSLILWPLFWHFWNLTGPLSADTSLYAILK